MGSGRRLGRLRGRGHERLGNRERGNRRGLGAPAMMGVGSRGQGTALELCGSAESWSQLSHCVALEKSHALSGPQFLLHRVMASLALRIYEHGKLTWGGCQLTRAQSKRNSRALSHNRAHQDSEPSPRTVQDRQSSQKDTRSLKDMGLRNWGVGTGGVAVGLTQFGAAVPSRSSQMSSHPLVSSLWMHQKQANGGLHPGLLTSGFSI